MASHQGDKDQSRLRFWVKGVRVSITLPPSVRNGFVMPSSDWMPFSHTEYRVLRALINERALSREELAQKLDESAEGRLKGVLATLVGRHVLLVGADGYRVNVTDDTRNEVKAWLEALSGTLGQG